MKLFRREKSIEMLEIINGVNVSDHVRKVRAVVRCVIACAFITIAGFLGMCSYFKYLNMTYPNPHPECGSGEMVVYTPASGGGYEQGCVNLRDFLEKAGLSVQVPTE